eukprot:CAMPEP_0198236318 /NCGR_PEP_ID=MMETSP1446-20131203/2213_1 /TAXON_ID=1461542 ORGANISM="Unidentified sp, Strain CCMP2111" /NCGR_SAMPLE_ID=MMETSP1446 /ASSEMBLY_ACC=CAM_ASM_001112 /LENGTH=35 /DNA_ID= /DNA_START= /DNA_END= /DNA_ORIENTATION=
MERRCFRRAVPNELLNLVWSALEASHSDGKKAHCN